MLIGGHALHEIYHEFKPSDVAGLCTTLHVIRRPAACPRDPIILINALLHLFPHCWSWHLVARNNRITQLLTQITHITWRVRNQNCIAFA